MCTTTSSRRIAASSITALVLASYVVVLVAGAVLSPAAAEPPTGGIGSQRAGHDHHKGPRRLRTGTVRGTLVALPPIVQPGTSPSAPRDAGSMVATFVPADPGQRVTLERQGRRGWETVAVGREDAWGSAAFAPPLGTYRARTESQGRTWLTGTVTTLRWTPSFEDTFSGTTLDASVWNDQRREHESVYAPRTCARVDAAARRVGEGVLHLGATVDPERAGMPCSWSTTRTSGTSPYLLNSQVATEFTRSFRHGVMAARIKPQHAKGMHSGFWMLPVGTTYVDGTPAGGTEIDVMEFSGETGRDNETVGSHVHYYEAGWNKVTLGDTFPVARRALGKGRSWWEEFHVFSVEWTPTEYVFRVDGREYYRETGAVSQAQQYLVLSNLTSDYELDQLTADELTDSAQVDWVRTFDTTSRQASRTSAGRED
jgi:hypothetical protein